MAIITLLVMGVLTATPRLIVVLLKELPFVRPSRRRSEDVAGVESRDDGRWKVVKVQSSQDWDKLADP